jgi:hypothetical protein
MPKANPLRTMMMPPQWYDGLDKGIRFAVRILHAHGFETCQSCQGGADPARPHRGHAYDRPTVDMVATGDDALGFGALATLQDFGLRVRDISILWNIKNGLPYEKLWRITFWETMESRADEVPMFVWGYQAQEQNK